MSENEQKPDFMPGAQPPAEPPGQPPPAAYAPPPVAPAANTSGMGGPVPEEIKGWNWGAFWLSWIWGIGNNVWISLLWFCLWIVWSIVLGIKGNEWAWQHRRFDSLEQFKQTQALWSKWGWIIGVVCLLGLILCVALFGAALLAFVGYFTTATSGNMPSN